MSNTPPFEPKVEEQPDPELPCPECGNRRTIGQPCSCHQQAGYDRRQGREIR